MKRIISGIVVLIFSNFSYASDIKWGCSGELGPYRGSVTEYHSTPLVILNNGHTIEVEYQPGSFLSAKKIIGFNRTIQSLQGNMRWKYPTHSKFEWPGSFITGVV